MDGVVAEKLQSEGALVSPATPIVTLVSGDVELAMSVEESKVGQLKEGQKAEINATAFPGEALQAAVSSISPTADAKSRTFQVKVKPTDQSGKLRPGMFAQVKIATSEKPKALLVPKDALVSRSGQTIVFVVKGDTVQQRTVTTGIIQNGTAEITNGLSAGEEVVTAGQNDLKDGSLVKKG
jgi:RND family efflux transporter MFP subunit